MAKVTYTTSTLATEFDTTPKELRKFLRDETSGIESVGKGGRYTLELTATQLNATKKKFAKWTAATETKRAEAKAARDAVAAEKALLLKADEGDHSDGAVTEADLEEFDAEYEPTDSDLEEFDADGDLDEIFEDIDEA